MSGSLKTAFALWVASTLPGVKVIGQQLANPNFQYPECLITDLGLSESMIGLPRNTDRVKNADGHVTARGKLFHEEINYRLTFTSPDNRTTGQPGLSVVEGLRRSMMDAIHLRQIMAKPLVVTDTEVNPSESFAIRKVEITGVSDIPYDSGQTPFLFRCALSIKLHRVVRRERPVDKVFKHIEVTEGPYEQEQR